jgi:iron complex outermembrane receptor protein
MSITSRIARVLTSGASITAISVFMTSAAHAQDTTSSTGQQTEQHSTAAADVAPEATATPPATEIVVTGRRQAIENATARKRNSDTVIDSVVADEAGKLPDTSLTEVLQRVSGVTITRFASLGSPDQFSFEGSGIQVRGLSNVLGLLNGREIFSANGGNGLNWGDVTPELMAAVDVYKASTSDLIEGGIGGAVDLRTRMPFDFNKPELDATLGGSYGDFSKSFTPSASVLVSDRWHTPLGEFGALLDLSYSRFKYADSFVRAEPYYQTTYDSKQVFVPGGFDYGNDSFDRKRRGLYAAFQWKPSDTLTIYQIDFVSNYRQTNGGGGVFAVNDVSNEVLSGTFDSNGVFQNGVVTGPGGASFFPGNSNNKTPSDTTTADYSQGFTWSPSDRFTLSGAVQFVHSIAKSDDYGLGIGSAGVPQVAMDFTGDLPQVGFNGTGDAITDPAQATVNDIIWNHQRNRANMTAENLDAEYNIDGSFFKKLKAGARYANRRENDSFVGTWWSATGRGWNGVPQSYVNTSPAGDFMLYDFPDFFKGKLGVPSSYFMASSSILQEGALQHDLDSYTSCSPSGTGPTFCDPATALYTDENFGNAPSLNETRTTSFDAYTELTFGSDNETLPFSGNVGVRIVHDTVHSTGNFTFNGGTSFYMNAADAAASYAAVGGADGLAAWQAAHPGQTLPYTYTTQQFVADRTDSNRYTRVLPSVNVNFKPGRAWVVRLAVNQTISPPNYNDVRASGSSGVVTTSSGYGPGFPDIFQGYSYGSGNVHLKPAVSTNEDLSIEWYPKPSTTAHIDLFNKSIDNLIIYNAVNVPSSAFFSGISPQVTGPNGTVSLPDGIVNGSGDYNAPKRSTIRGFEAGFRTYFDMLPGALKGLGIDANFTYIDSSSPSNLAYDMQGNELSNIPIVGLSKYNYNIQLLYDLGRWDARLAYSWRSKYLATTTGNGTQGTYQINGVDNTINYALPVYGAAIGTLDASLSYKFNDHFSLSVDGSNLFDNVSKTIMEILPGVYETRSWFINDRRVAVTAHLHF